MRFMAAMILTASMALAGGCDRGGEQVLRGTVQILPTNLEGTWIVKSPGDEGLQTRLVSVSPETRIETAQGPVEKGADIEVAGRKKGNYLLATAITVGPGSANSRRIW